MGEVRRRGRPNPPKTGEYMVSIHVKRAAESQWIGGAHSVTNVLCLFTKQCDKARRDRPLPPTSRRHALGRVPSGRACCAHLSTAGLAALEGPRERDLTLDLGVATGFSIPRGHVGFTPYLSASLSYSVSSLPA